jgi:multiple sugar transport system substrate-binding protein
LLFLGCGERNAAPKTPVRISNWLHAAVDPNFLRLEREFESGFEQRHPRVALKIEPIPGVGQYAPKLILMHVAGSMPDAGYLDVSSGAIFTGNGLVRDLAPFIRDDPEFNLDDYFPAVTASFRRGGQIFGVPLDFTPMVIFYNKRLFDERSVPYPQDGWSWADFLETARKLSDPRESSRQFALHFENFTARWIVWLMSNGGDLLTPDGARAMGALDSPATIEAIEFLLSLMYDERVAPSLHELQALGVDLFLAGRAAMDLKGHWMLIDYRTAGLDVGVVSVPTNIGRPVTVLYQSGLCVFAKAREPKLGWEYVKYMTSEPVQTKRVASGIAISGNRHTAAKYAGNPVEDAFLRQIAYARPPWGATVERYPLVEELAQEMMRTIIHRGAERATRHATVERLTRETAALIDAALKSD